MTPFSSGPNILYSDIIDSEVYDDGEIKSEENINNYGILYTDIYLYT